MSEQRSSLPLGLFMNTVMGGPSSFAVILDDMHDMNDFSDQPVASLEQHH